MSVRSSWRSVAKSNEKLVNQNVQHCSYLGCPLACASKQDLAVFASLRDLFVCFYLTYLYHVDINLLFTYCTELKSNSPAAVNKILFEVYAVQIVSSSNCLNDLSCAFFEAVANYTHHQVFHTKLPYELSANTISCTLFWRSIFIITRYHKYCKRTHSWIVPALNLYAWFDEIKCKLNLSLEAGAPWRITKNLC